MDRIYILFVIVLCSGCNTSKDYEKVKKSFRLFEQSAEEVIAKSDQLKNLHPRGLTIYSRQFLKSPVDSLKDFENTQILIKTGLVDNIYFDTSGNICYNTRNDNDMAGMTRYFLLYHPYSKRNIESFISFGYEIKSQINMFSKWTYYSVKQSPD